MKLVQAYLSAVKLHYSKFNHHASLFMCAWCVGQISCMHRRRPVMLVDACLSSRKRLRDEFSPLWTSCETRVSAGKLRYSRFNRFGCPVKAM